MLVSWWCLYDQTDQWEARHSTWQVILHTTSSSETYKLKILCASTSFYIIKIRRGSVFSVPTWWIKRGKILYLFQLSLTNPGGAAGVRPQGSRFLTIFFAKHSCIGSRTPLWGWHPLREILDPTLVVLYYWGLRSYIDKEGHLDMKADH